MNLIEFKNVSKTYRKHFWTPQFTAVNALSFSIDANKIVGFVGPNGAGKTTSIKMLLGLVRPTSGRVFLRGKDVADPNSRKEIAYLSEQPYFYEHLTVRESLEFAYRLLKLPRSQCNGEIDRIVKTVELKGAENKRVSEMSKGMQQRLSMAQALLGDPAAFIFDEPMSGLDPLGRSLFRRIFRDLIHQGKSIFFSTHILEDIESLCDEIVVLSRGSLVYQGAVAAILEKGFLGTEIKVSEIAPELGEILERRDCEISSRDQNGTIVFVPKTGDPSAIQRILYEHDLFCESITRRNKSLEALLYENPEHLQDGVSSQEGAQ